MLEKGTCYFSNSSPLIAPLVCLRTRILATPCKRLRLGEDMLSRATVRPLANAFRLQTPARLTATPVRFASNLIDTSCGRRDPHAVLGVPYGCSKGELKKAFHRSSWDWHPDRATASDRPAAEVRPGERSKPLAAPPPWSGLLTQRAPCPRALQQAFKELSEAYLKLSGDKPGGRASWPFDGSRNLRPAPPVEQHSIFVEFLGVRRLARERTWSHMLRAALCCRVAPKQHRPLW